MTDFKMTATKVSHDRMFPSCPTWRFTLAAEIDGLPVLLPGSFAVHVDDIDASIWRELVRWNTDFSWCKPDPSAPLVEYQTSITKVQAFREAREERVTHGGSMMPPHDAPMSDEFMQQMFDAIKEAV